MLDLGRATGMKTRTSWFLEDARRVHMRRLDRSWSAVKAVRRISRRALLTIGAALVALGAAGAVPEGRLFHIERSKNANIVAYDVRLNPRGTIDTSNPIDGYWVRLAEKGQRKELGSVEKRLAYGWKAKPVGEDKVELVLTALPERPIMVERGKYGYEAHLPIQGVPARLLKVYVKTKEGGVLPKVEYIELYGYRLDNGESVKERQTKR